MINHNSSTALRAFLDREGLAMQKRFGQNFLINPQVRQTLVETLGTQNGDEVWEIGPGLGAMTTLLLEKGLKVKAFEIDLGFIRVLKNMFSQEERFKLIEGDVLKTWHTQKHTIPTDAPGMSYLLGNLPYNIAAVFLADLIENGCVFSRMVVTVQKEVALRMAAAAGTKDYSSFSVLCASAYKVKPLMTIRPSSFYPQPNVDSMGVLLEKRLEAVNYNKNFYSLVRSLFSARRKTIKNNLLTFLSSCRQDLRLDTQQKPTEACFNILHENNLTGNERAEDLELEKFVSLAKTIENMRLSK